MGSTVTVMLLVLAPDSRPNWLAVTFRRTGGFLGSGPDLGLEAAMTHRNTPHRLLRTGVSVHLQPTSTTRNRHQALCWGQTGSSQRPRPGKLNLPTSSLLAFLAPHPTTPESDGDGCDVQSGMSGPRNSSARRASRAPWVSIHAPTLKGGCRECGCFGRD